MLQQEEPQDYVVATGEQHSVREFIELAAKELGMQITWTGTGSDEKGVDSTGKVIIAISPRYFRPAEVQTLLGNAAKAREKLGWKPKYGFHKLVSEMVRADLAAAKRDHLIKQNGFKTRGYDE